MYLTKRAIHVNELVAEKADESCGASASFVGMVRNHHQGKAVQKLFYECYEPMAEKQLAAIVTRAREKWCAEDIRVRHRIGWLEVGEVAVAIVVNSAHRNEAFEACRSIIEEIKKIVPIWKREVYVDGTEQWVSCTHASEAVT